MEDVNMYGVGANADGTANVLPNGNNNSGAETCRLCLKRLEVGENFVYRDLFRTDLPQKLMAFTSVQIQENDGLPSTICTHCSDLVYMSYNFKCQVEKSDHDLRQTLLIRQSPSHWPTEETVVSAIQKKISSVIEHESIFVNSNSVPLGIDNKVLESGNSEDDVSINFEAQYENKYAVGKNCLKSEPKNIQENFNSNQSDDEKPLILRTKRHKCNYCIKSFANLTLLEKHAVIHKKQPNIIYICYLCDEQFASLDKVKNHAMAVHAVDIDRNKLMENSKMRRITGWVQKTGDEKTVEEINKFVCKVCSRQFTNNKLYLAHMRAHSRHNKLSKDSNNGSDIAASANKKTHPENATVSSESQSVEGRDPQVNIQLRSHSKKIQASLPVNATPNSQPVRTENTSNVGDISHRDTTDESEDNDEDNDQNDGSTPPGNIQCNECGKLVATLRNLKRHLLTHSGLKHNCSICGKDFSRSDKLKEHQQLKHKEELLGKSDSENESVDSKKVTRKKSKKKQAYKCSLCPKAFAQAQTLANHEERHRRVQDVHKRYLCEICSKCFAQSGSLVAHMRTHTGVKPYVCQICSRAFTKSTYLQLHLRTHSGEKPYICQYCSRAFARANTLARHITMHTGEAKYQCQICEKSFRRLTSLNEHTYTHTGQRPYACKICSKTYNNAGSLYAHTKKCKTMQATPDTPETLDTPDTSDTTMTYPISMESTETVMVSDSDINLVPQLLIFTDKKLEDTITDEMLMSEHPTCQFMIANIPGQKPMSTNMLDQFIIQEPDVYSLNSKQFKTSYYGLYPSM